MRRPHHSHSSDSKYNRHDSGLSAAEGEVPSLGQQSHDGRPHTTAAIDTLRAHSVILCDMAACAEVLFRCAASDLTVFCLTRSHTELIEEVSRNVLAAPRIQRLADIIVSRLSAAGAAINGVHLRLELDANFQTRVAGGETV